MDLIQANVVLAVACIAELGHYENGKVDTRLEKGLSG